MTGLDPEWVEEAIAKAATVPYETDDTYLHAVCAAVQDALRALIASRDAYITTLNEHTDARIAERKAFEAVWAAEDALRQMPTSATVQ